MKSPPMTASSGSCSGSKKVASRPTGSGVKRTSNPTKKASKGYQVMEGESPRDEKKWQAFFDSACDVSADDETVRERLFDVLEEERAKREVEEECPMDAGECPEYDVKGLMVQIYQDLNNVALAQASRAASGGSRPRRPFGGELSDTEVLLREVSFNVANVISKSLQSRSASTTASLSTDSVRTHRHTSEHLESSEVQDIDKHMARCLLHEAAANERYRKTATDHSWEFLGKLAHSTAFCDAACAVDEEVWQTVSASIDENAVSLTVFAECCGLDWWTELVRHSAFLPPPWDFTKHLPVNPKRCSPHEWVVTEKLEDIRRPEFEGKRQVNIADNIYRDDAFKHSVRPPFWPPSLPYPNDPTKIHNTSKKPCITCDSYTPCDCSFSAHPPILHPLVELRDYGRKGVGVRALQRIPRGSILGEYVGELFPACYTGDPIYALDLALPGGRNDEVVATISAKAFGNWTRFINHACDASTEFRIVTQGGRYRSVVVAARDIEAFEEITVDYGDGYWRDRACECGAEECYEKTKSKMVKAEKEGPESWDLSTITHED